jgi:hypothetical protein
VHLKQGDVILQQATNHGCVNRGDQPCRNPGRVDGFQGGLKAASRAPRYSIT